LLYPHLWQPEHFNTVHFLFKELAELKERIAKENAEAEAKKAAEGPTKSDEKKETEAKSALEAAMAATLAEYAPPGSANGPQAAGTSWHHATMFIYSILM